MLPQVEKIGADHEISKIPCENIAASCHAIISFKMCFKLVEGCNISSLKLYLCFYFS
ncbi:hypothetical protein SLEP1_g38112 [Rubroshorea leprosula]|uniref:Uncharacterized protein n=1 Tax=Rubroshorea leprosula TaxID=152421 RepID=A0AAV5KWV8_9ROSI|nr:hypothetical protein SLEP1_g38112 [Rubroshorea leprosula]